ncbi:hypothetical protein CLIB1423_13S00122 [[Candida] railenensis]|uniref:N-acetyltransferase domain-containing protein n=1 Tax=[Candida] railenensis TaxID=45579 RepID=A0A9P0VYK1_9ASCO|nr:hypothetical protein CLIB1423_13S00122 [[Candida] railenensis]
MDYQRSRAIGVIERAFFNVPMCRYKLRVSHKLDETGTPLDFDTHFKDSTIKRVTQLVDAGGIILQFQDFAAVAIWFPPGVKPPAGDSEGTPSYVDYYSKSTAIKKKNHEKLGNEYWYLNTIARDPDITYGHEGIRSSGVVGPLIRSILWQASQNNIPAVLEAISDRARDIYLHYGFEVVDTFELGQGEEIYTVYLMIHNKTAEEYEESSK